MKWILAVCLVLFLLAVAQIAIINVAFSFEPQNLRHYPGSSTNSPMMVKVGSTGVMHWAAEDSYGYPGWRNLVYDFLSTGSNESTSLGNTINRFLASEGRGSITIQENSGSPDLRLVVASTAFVEAKCGTGSYTACVYLLNPLPAPAYFKASVMLQYQRSGAGAVIIHEAFHALGRACDQYPGGCPRVSDGQWGSLGCTGNPETVMDCGGAARTAQRFDYDTFVGAYHPATSFLQTQQPTPTLCNPPNPYPYWDGDGCVFADGWKFRPNSDDGQWIDPQGRLVWDDIDPSWNGRYSPVCRAWFQRGHDGTAFCDGYGWLSMVIP